MNWRAIVAIVRKDIYVVLHSKGVLIPLIVVPLLLTVAMPALLATMPRFADMAALPSSRGINAWIEQLPATLRDQLSIYTGEQRMVILLVVYYLAPMYLILPLMVASVLAADSIVGEKERKSLESLLYTPTTDFELFAAKFLGAWAPAVAVAWGGFILYSIVVNIAGWPIMGRIFFPNAMWWLLALWVAPGLAGLGLGFTVLISARVNTFQEAYQLGGVIVIPIVGLIIGQAAGLLYFNTWLVFLLGLILWILDMGVLWWGGRIFRRTELAMRL